MWEIKWDFGLWEFAPLPGETQPHVSTGGASGAWCWAPDVCVGHKDMCTQMSVWGRAASPSLRGGVAPPAPP